VRREHELGRRLRSLHALGEAVGAMKSLSARHFRETRAAVQPARVYREGVQGVLARTRGRLSGGRGPAGLLIIGGELGLCGGYNARLVAAGAELRARLGPGPTVCVGRRAGVLLVRFGVELRRIHSGPTSVVGIPALLLRLAEEILTAFVNEELSSVHVVSSRFGGVAADRPEAMRLLPLEPADGDRAPAARYQSAASQATAAVREFLYVTLYDLLLDALASEHGARLVATQLAEEWLDQRIDRLRRRLAAIRREATTQEMIEIAAGARAWARRERGARTR
jgi:F-type H+-transporting ATPase subunit gamma